MNNLVTIGLPSKGRLKDRAVSFFDKNGLKILQSKKERNYFGSIENKPNIKIIFLHAKEIIKIIKSFLKINCKLSELEKNLLEFAKKNSLNKNIFKEFKSIQNLKTLKQDVNFIANFGREVEYYTGIVFEVCSGTKEIARGGRYNDLLKSLGAKKNIPAVGAAINLKNI